jgi:hypothetical protein
VAAWQDRHRQGCKSTSGGCCGATSPPGLAVAADPRLSRVLRGYAYKRRTYEPDADVSRSGVVEVEGVGRMVVLKDRQGHVLRVVEITRHGNLGESLPYWPRLLDPPPVHA